MPELIWEIFFFIRGEQILDEISENLTLSNLSPESEQNLTCAGVNSVGPGDESEPYLVNVFGKTSKFHFSGKLYAMPRCKLTTLIKLTFHTFICMQKIKSNLFYLTKKERQRKEYTINSQSISIPNRSVDRGIFIEDHIPKS